MSKKNDPQTISKNPFLQCVYYWYNLLQWKFFILCDNWKTLVFIIVYRYTEIVLTAMFLLSLILLYKWHFSLKTNLSGSMLFITILTDHLKKVRTKIQNRTEIMKFWRFLCVRTMWMTPNRTMKSENIEKRKPSFTKRIGRKCRLKLVLNKIMIAREWCIKYNFVAPLIHNVLKWSDTLLKFLQQMLQGFKGTPIQIWKSPHIFRFIKK